MNKQESLNNYSPFNLNLWVLLFGVGTISIIIFPTAYDPFNAAKQFTLGIIGAWLLGTLLLEYWRIRKESALQLACAFTGLLVIGLLLDFFHSGTLTTAFFGDDRRNSGLITYLLLLVIFLSAAVFIREFHLQLLEFMVLASSFLISGYGYLQHIGKDWIHWNNQYNSIISFLGNPDFASAVMGILATVTFGIAFNSARNLYYRITAGLLTLFALYVSYESQARQGWLIGLFGIGFIVLVGIYQKYKVVGHTCTGLGIIFGIFVIAGMLQAGPLSSYLYKTSVTYRGDYWRAAWRMFKSHPIFGVGLDRYGYYFEQYRDATQTLRRSPGLVSNATHNVPLQLASTGGLLLFLPYLAFTIYTGYRGFKALKKATGPTQIAVASILGAWITYEIQSFISIDNIGIVVWGYLFGGAIIGLSLKNQNSPHKINNPKKKSNSVPAQTNQSNIVILQSTLSILLLILAVTTLQPRLNSSKNSLILISTQNPISEYPQVRTAIDKAVNSGAFNEVLALQYADRLYQMQISDTNTQHSVPVTQIYTAPYFADSFALFNRITKYDPHYAQAFLDEAGDYDSLANFLNQNGFKAAGQVMLQEALILRAHLLEIDPWDYQSGYLYAADLKAVGQTAESKRIAKNIISYIDLHWKDSRIGSTMATKPPEYNESKALLN